MEQLYPGDSFPLSFAQERLWFLYLLAPEEAAYNTILALDLAGPLDVEAFRRSLEEIVRRHEILRTAFSWTPEGTACQRPLPAGGFPLPLVDLSGLPAADEEVRRVAEAEARRPFDLRSGPPFRALLARIADGRWRAVLCLHHIVGDGWSLEVILGELAAHYAAFREGRPSPLPEPPLQYADFAVWQRERLQGETLEELVAFWRRELAGAPDGIGLPLDRPRPAVQSFRGSRVVDRLPEGPLTALAREAGATLFMVLLAGFQAFLYRITGRTDLPVGSPVANRDHTELEELVGLFVNTLVFRGRIDPDEPFRDLLERTREAVVAALAHQEMPFERLVRALGIERRPDRNPLFQVAISSQGVAPEPPAIPGLEVEVVDGLALDAAPFDLHLSFQRQEGDLILTLEYASALFDHATARRLLGQLRRLLEGIGEDAGQPVRDLLPLVSDIAVETAPGLFAARARETPDAVALIYQGRRISYAELDDRATRLARRLRALGVDPESRVALLAGRTPEMVAGLLGIWKAGGAFVPLDPAQPDARLAALLEDAAPAALVTERALRDRFPGWPTLLLDEDGEGPDLPLPEPRPGDLAYVIYTSGTTGFPKGVLVEHGSLAFTLAAARRAFGLGPGDRMPAIAASTFDIFLFELLGPLLAGGACVLLPVRPAPDLDRVVDELAHATLFHAVPAVMRQVVDLVRRRRAPTALRALFTGGDAVPADLLADLRETFPRAEVWELYGPTEAAIFGTAWRVPEVPTHSLLGFPLPGVEIELRDGEIWIGGPGVARGYWRREELTAQRFVENEGRHFFRSGDLARRLPDGALEFLGRADQQVKVRGVRIEPAEVEAALLRLPGVAQAAVGVREVTPGAGLQLVAWVVPDHEEPAVAAKAVEQWRTLYDETYRKGATADPAFDVTGWNSSYTGRPIPEEEMREWVDSTVERLLPLLPPGPARVLEVGCGTGLLLFRLAPRCALYRATDFSGVVLDRLRRRLGQADLPQVELAHAAADDWRGVPPRSFDLVILNSLTQNFPDVHYLLRVLAGAARAARPGGAVFVGDIRNLELLEDFHASVELHRAAGEESVEELRRRIRREVGNDQELVVAPALFPALVDYLPEVREADVLLKQGTFANELNRFRYDAVLRIAEPAERPAAAARRPWREYANDPLRGRRERRLTAELRRALQAELPAHMVPSQFVVLDALPLTPHGKVDRQALPAPERVTGHADSAPPHSPVEERLAAIWGALLRVDRVGADDDFFALGGHSLLALQAVSRVREAFGVELPVEALFEDPTPAALARRIEAGSGAEPVPPVPPADRSGGLPLSFAQERLWFLDRLLPGNAYNVPLVLRLRGRLDIAAWAAAWDEVRRRHEALRTTFHAGPGGPAQAIAPWSPLGLPVIDLTDLPAAEGEALRLAAVEAARPFDLARSLPARASLLRLAEEDHLFVAVFHHIVSDAWSMGVALSEMRELYAGGSLPDLPVQPADHAVWERRRLERPESGALIAWWRERLAGLPPLELPADRRSPQVQTFRGRTLPEALPEGLSRALGTLGDGTLFMAALAAFAAFLHRVTGAVDLAVGTPAAHRDRPELEGLIGFFVNTLAIRLDLSGDPPFSELLGRVRGAVLAAWARREIPFDRLVEELRPERRPDENPLFRVAFSLDRPVRPDFSGVGLEVSPVRVHPGTAKFDLYLGLEERPEGIEGTWEAKADLFDVPTLARLAGHWRSLVEDLAAHPERRIGELALLSPAERHQVQVEWIGAPADYPREATLPELFGRQVARTPNAVALVQGEETLTYRELDARAERLAAELRALGVGPDVPVALSLPQSFERIVAILGILKAGGAYVPIDPSYPADRRELLLRDSGALIPGTPGVPAVPGAPAPDSLAYVMYTSGSTGEPKGVAVTHRNVARLVLGADYARFGPDEVFLQLALVSFDASTLEIWGPLLHGGRLVLPPEGRTSLSELGGLIRDHGVTTLWLTAGLFHSMVDEEIGGLAGVRQLLAGGDVLSPAHVRRALERLPGTVVIDGYGPTEGTTFSACHRMTAPEEVDSPVPIGRPIANTTVRVLDGGMRPVPAGTPGDLYVGGDGLARGYHGQPDLTAERFVPDPFSTGGRLYRTGDRARWLSKGALDFLGRADRQVKIAGWRIEPGEVEAALAAHPQVREAAVVPVEDGAGRRLAAYVASAADPAELRAWLRERLPEPMIPSLWVPLDRLPLTPNGKVDRAALPAPGMAAGVAKDAPTGPAGELLAGIWAELLGVERVGAREDFFELGGTSLLATRLIARVHASFGVDLPLRDLFETPTVAGLAVRIAEASGGGPPPPIEPLPAAETYPASLAQRRLWFLDRLSPGGFFLNVPHGLRLRGMLEIPALRRALSGIVARHEPLRTTFETRDGQPVQRIAPPSALPLPEIDLSALMPARREAEARRLAREQAERPFDLSRGPLFRAVLARLDAADHLLVFTPHHLVFDGASMEVLFRDLAALYSEAALPPLPVRFVEFSEWQRRTLSGERLETQLAWWRERLAGLPTLDLPTDHPRPPAPRFGGSWRTAEAPRLWGRIEILARRHGATPYLVLLAGFAALLSRLSGQEDLAIGSPVANRPRPEVEGLIGFFANTLVMRADLAGNPGFSGLLARARESALGAWAHQDLPFEVLVEELAPERHLSLNPLFQVVLSLQELPPGFDLPGLEARLFEFEAGVAHFDLTLIAARAGESLALTLNYKRDLFDPPTVLRWLGQLGNLLEAAAAGPETPVRDLPLWSEAAWHQAVLEWSGAGALAAEGTTVDRLVEERARRTPEAPAVAGPAGPDESLTYGELDSQANRLARRLRRLGVGRGDRVALALERSPKLVMAALAVWKTGAAYLPLDPANPAERLTEIVEDARARRVITLDRWADRFPGRAVALDRDPWMTERDLNPDRETGPGDAAYVIYTSGSTGRPKGVEVPHAGLLGLIDWHLRAYGPTPADRGSLVASPAFDASVWETWPSLVAGMSLHVPPRDVALSPASLLDWLAAERITLAFLPTPLAEDVLDREMPGGLALRVLLTGGDRLRRAPAADPGFRLVNHYGPTESSVVATRGEVAPGGSRPPDIGRAVEGVEVLLLDPGLRPVPPGALGEICLGGRGLATGYPGHPDRTAERFVPHPYALQPGARLYRTGDLGRARPDGRIEFAGRADDQVKIRGFRVEPGEVEARLAAHPALREAVVAALGGPAGPRLAAWFVPRPGQAPTVAELRDFLRALLPEPMVPSAWMEIPALPLTSRGKVDRDALPPPPEAGEAPREAPRGDLEETIARLWREVLGVRAAGRDDNFFDLGGHSLALAAVHERLQAELAVRIPLVELFENPTVRSLAARLAGDRPEAAPAAALDRAGRQRGAGAWSERMRQARAQQRPR